MLATFTSADPKYGNATLVGKLTINKGQSCIQPADSETTIAIGTASTIVSGHIGTGSAYPAGEYVIITLNGVSVATSVDNNGNFSTALDTSTLALGNYTITLCLCGRLEPPCRCHRPELAESDPDRRPPPSVQWQVSTDGGATYSDIAGATSTTLTFITSLSENGYLYQAVFTNSWAPSPPPPPC